MSAAGLAAVDIFIRLSLVDKFKSPRITALFSYDQRPYQIYPQAAVDRIRAPNLFYQAKAQVLQFLPDT